MKQYPRRQYRHLGWVIAFALVACNAGPAEAQDKFVVTTYIEAAPPDVSPEGFIDGANKWSVDSVTDLRKALDGKWFHPNKGWPGSKTYFTVTNDKANADIGLLIGARGISEASFGQRTTMEFYRGVILADTVPTVGVTRWVSMILSADTYRKEFVAWSTNRSRFSAGAWTKDAKLLALTAAGWVMANEAQIKERQRARQRQANAR